MSDVSQEYGAEAALEEAAALTATTKRGGQEVGNDNKVVEDTKPGKLLAFGCIYYG